MVQNQTDVEAPHHADAVVGVPAAEVRAMVIVAGIAFLALFSLVSILLGSEDGREAPDPTGQIATWILFGYGMR